LNFDQTHYIQFTTKNSPQVDLDISYANKLISEAYDTEFIGIYVGSVLPWEIHIEKFTHYLNAACYAVSSVKPFMSQETLKMFYTPIFIP
jgi:hypothetical protein